MIIFLKSVKKGRALKVKGKTMNKILIFSLSGIIRRHGEGTVEPQHGLREEKGPDDSREVVEKMDALVGPSAFDFTDPHGCSLK